MVAGLMATLISAGTAKMAPAVIIAANIQANQLALTIFVKRTQMDAREPTGPESHHRVAKPNSSLAIDILTVLRASGSSRATGGRTNRRSHDSLRLTACRRRSSYPSTNRQPKSPQPNSKRKKLTVTRSTLGEPRRKSPNKGVEQRSRRLGLRLRRRRTRAYSQSSSSATAI